MISIVVGGTEQTRIDTANPARLEFEYMQQMDAVVRAAWPEPHPLKVAHVGGCGCALAWAWEERRPNSRQLAIEVDPWIAEQARVWFPLPRKPQLRIRVADGREALESSQAAFDVIVRDAFIDAMVPAHMQTLEWSRLVKSRLGAQGLYLANAAHGKGTDARPDIAAVQAVFSHILIIGDSKVIKGARWGNLLIAAWQDDELLDRDEVDRQLRRLPLPARVLKSSDLSRWLGGAKPVGDPPSDD